MTESSTIHVGHRKIQYVLSENSNLKTVRLKLTPDLKLEVSVPSTSKVDVSRLLKRKMGWIERKYDQIVNSKRIFDGRRILYRGEYREQEGMSKDWMTNETERIIREKLREFSGRFKLSFNDFVVMGMRKWAYCTRDRRLVFNWQLAALPDELVDYVVLHELVHLREFSHSKRFKYLLASVCPDFKDKENMLKRFIAE
ncbi:MAG TPA: YgjP-like metallopeptidase domain-containing protein [Candidatus Bathyarchaeia archaeon]|nr:YgjP-like metallopeptidase domain-containing protein [Candidatus Bathyarchaeia archaeon]